MTGEADPSSKPADEVNTAHQLHSQLNCILSIVTATANQVQWLCNQVDMAYQMMPPFMRKGLVSDVDQPR